MPSKKSKKVVAEEERVEPVYLEVQDHSPYYRSVQSLVRARWIHEVLWFCEPCRGHEREFLLRPATSKYPSRGPMRVRRCLGGDDLPLAARCLPVPPRAWILRDVFTAECEKSYSGEPKDPSGEKNKIDVV